MIVPYAVVLGVAIDIDHLVIARVNHGDWRLLKHCLTHPSSVLFEQETLLGPDDVHPLQRLLSHMILGGGLVAGLSMVNLFFAHVSIVVIYFHVVADLVADMYPTRFYESD